LHFTTPLLPLLFLCLLFTKREILNHFSPVAEPKPEANSGSSLSASTPPFPPCKSLPTLTFLFNSKICKTSFCCWEPFSF